MDDHYEIILILDCSLVKYFYVYDSKNCSYMYQELLYMDA